MVAAGADAIRLPTECCWESFTTILPRLVAAPGLRIVTDGPPRGRRRHGSATVAACREPIAGVRRAGSLVNETGGF